MTRTARLIWTPSATLAAALALPGAASAAGSSPPAGGAALGQVIGASFAAAVLSGALLVLGFGHRSGRVRVLTWASDTAERVSGMPGWAALPTALAAGALVCAVFGLYWDISLHIDNGRDPGPLANPAHYFILAGLFGIFSAGWLAIVIPDRRPGPAAVRIGPHWEVPVGGIVLLACASFALLGFPLDDVWHRLFGQDVTLWGPTHLMMLSGAALTLLGILALLTEGRLASGDAPPRHDAPRLGVLALAARALHGANAARVQRLFACGGLLVGLSIYQGEFDFGVPQFRLLFHPVLIAFAAGMALVAGRLIVGRGGALGAALFFIVLRGVLTLLVGPVLGEATPHFPLYLAEAAVVEAAAWRGVSRPYAFAAASGVSIGTVGTVAEWGWSHVWMPLAWPSHLLPAAIGLSVVVGVAGGVLGAFLFGGVRVREPVAGTRRAWIAAAASAVAVAIVVGLLLPTTVPGGARADVTLTKVAGGAYATVRVHPSSLPHGADWWSTISWQGHDKLVIGRLRRIGDGVYRTTRPLPIDGTWKTAVRFHRGSEMASVPIYLPVDRAIPVAGVPAFARFDRAFVADHTILQRERKQGVAGWLWGVAGAVVLVCCTALLVLLGWALARLARGEAPARRTAPPQPARAAAGVAS